MKRSATATACIIVVLFVSGLLPWLSALERRRKDTDPGDGGGGPPSVVDVVVNDLDLTRAQRRQVLQIIIAHEASMRAARTAAPADVRNARRALLRDIVNVLTLSQRERLRRRLERSLHDP